MNAPDWSAIYCEHHAGIRAVIGGRIDDCDLADDLTAEVFCKAMAAYAAGKGSRVHLRGWLYRIAHNLVNDHYRRKARTGTTTDIDDFGDLLADPHNVEGIHIGEQIERALRRLTHGQLVALRGRIEGYTAHEVAEALGGHEPGAKGLLHRARLQLRVELAELRVRRE